MAIGSFILGGLAQMLSQKAPATSAAGSSGFDPYKPGQDIPGSAAVNGLGLGDQLAQDQKDLEEQRRKKLLQQNQAPMSPAAMALGLNSGKSSNNGFGL